MISFPETIEIRAREKVLSFQIIPINSTIFAIRQDTHLIKNEDNMTFGYIVYRKDFLYAYAILPTKEDETMTLRPSDVKYDYHLIYSSFIGSEEEVSIQASLVEDVIMLIAKTFVQYEQCENRHPSVIDSERFLHIYNSLKHDIKAFGDNGVTPFVTPISQTAIELRDFYIKLVEDLDALES